MHRQRARGRVHTTPAVPVVPPPARARPATAGPAPVLSSNDADACLTAIAWLFPSLSSLTHQRRYQAATPFEHPAGNGTSYTNIWGHNRLFFHAREYRTTIVNGRVVYRNGSFACSIDERDLAGAIDAELDKLRKQRVNN